MNSGSQGAFSRIAVVNRGEPAMRLINAVVIAWGRDRPEARARLSRALRQTAAVIKGGITNRGFLLDVLDRPEFIRGEVDTTWLDTMMAGGYAPPRRSRSGSSWAGPSPTTASPGSSPPPSSARRCTGSSSACSASGTTRSCSR